MRKQTLLGAAVMNSPEANPLSPRNVLRLALSFFVVLSDISSSASLTALS